MNTILKFKSVDSNLKHRNGQTVEITEHITEASEEFDAEVLPMMRIKFGDGYVTECWPDELIPATVTKNAYGSLSYYRA